MLRDSIRLHESGTGAALATIHPAFTHQLCTAPTSASPATPGVEPPLTEEQRLQLGGFYTPLAQRPRVVLRFASNEKKLLISGMLAGGSELANAPAVIDVPVGNGHVIMFANNPMWRHQTQGSFFLIFNTAFNFDSLNTERAIPTPRPSPTPGTGDDAQ